MRRRKDPVAVIAELLCVLIVALAVLFALHFSSGGSAPNDDPPEEYIGPNIP